MEDYSSFNELDILTDSAQRNETINEGRNEIMDSMVFPLTTSTTNYNLFQDDLMFLDLDVNEIFGESATKSATTNECELFKTSMNSLSTIEAPSVLPIDANGDWMLLPIPENLQSEPIINNLDSIQLETSTIEEINSSVSGYQGVKVSGENSVQSNIVSRPPVQMIQQVIQFPATKKSITMDAPKVGHKRKQVFEFPREDGVMFYWDSDNEEPSPPEKVIIIDVEGEPEAKAAGDENNANKVVLKTPAKPKRKEKVQKDVTEKMETCPTCEKVYKRLSLHRCKKDEKSDNVANRKSNVTSDEGSKSVDVPAKSLAVPKKKKSFKCKHCVESFYHKSELDLHFSAYHASLKCDKCEFVGKNKRGLDVHLQLCSGSKKRAKKRSLEIEKTQMTEAKKQKISKPNNKVEVKKELRKRKK